MSVTPLLDLVFVLLFVFMVAAPMLKSGPEVDLAVAPSPPGDGAAEPGETVDLTMTKDLTLLFDGSPVARADLEEVLREWIVTRPGAGVVVRMDRTLEVGHLVDLMGALESAGVERTAVAATAGEEAR